MKKSSTAALLSGLIFPGIGHLVLKQYLRGSILVLFALVALSVIVTRIFQQALTRKNRLYERPLATQSTRISARLPHGFSTAHDHPQLDYRSLDAPITVLWRCV